jgi:LacI family transcriptional regulator
MKTRTMTVRDKDRKTTKRLTATKNGGSITLADVARKAGVSRQTAGAILLGGTTNSRAGEETIKRVKAAGQLLNYQPNHAARALKGVKSKQVGILNRVRSDDDPSHALITRNLVEELNRRGMTTSLAMYVEGGRTHVELVEELLTVGIDALIVLDHRLLSDRKTLTRILELCPRTVFYQGGNALPHRIGAAVDVDRARAARMAVSHLFERGRRNIGVFAAREQFVGDMTRAAAKFTRMAGLLEEFSARGMVLDESMIFVSPYSSTDFSFDRSKLFESVQEAIVRLVQKKRADAILILTVFPAATVAFVQKLIEMGHSVPGEVAVITIRDYPAYPVFSPSITTVTLHHDQVAAPLVNLIESVISGKSLPEEESYIRIAPELMIRGTT